MNPAIFDRSLSIRSSQYVADKVMPAHADYCTRLSIVVAGQLLESVGRRDEYANAGSVVIKPGHVIHQNRFGPDGARTLSIELPTWLVNEQPKTLVDQWHWFHGGPLSIAVHRLWLAARASAHEHSELTSVLADRLIDIVAAASELGSAATGHRRPPSWLERVRQQLHDNYATGEQVITLAASAGVHPVYLARVFRRYFQCSIVDYLQALRLNAALERMAISREAFADIAAAQGYADQSHLSRVCKNRLGHTPKQCRALLVH